VLATSWFSQKMLTPPTTAGDQRSAAMSQQMQIMMPLLFGFMSINFASGLSIYFIISNLVTMLQYYMILPKRQPTQGEEGANLWERILSFPARAWKRLSPKG
jgi:membrane protein insertase Oxa1/YidC/SpoIIIJ